MLCAFVKCVMVLAKPTHFLLFSAAQARNEYSPQLSKLPALVAHTGTGGALPALVALCVKGLLPR
jgi:hypothetical protein